MRPVVSDHALLRWLERVWKINLDTVRAEIMTPEVLAAAKAGATALTQGGVTRVLDRGRVVTIKFDGLGRKSSPGGKNRRYQFGGK